MGWWFGSPLWARVIGGLVVGTIVGLALGSAGLQGFASDVVQPFGAAFVKLIRMLIVPLIFFTLASGVIAMGDPKKLGSLGGRTIGMYMATTAVAVCFGLLMATIVQPGAGVEYATASAEAQAQVSGRLAAAGSTDQSIAAKLLAIIPDNPIQAFAEADVLAIIFFSIMFGLGILLAGEKAQLVAKGIDGGAAAMIKITEVIMELAPIGVFALMTWVMATQGLSVLENLLKLALALYVACALQIIFVYGGIIKGVLRLPLVRFYRGVADAQAVAFSTSSSSATLPVTIACATDNLGVKKSVAGSVLPIGATINMDGTAIYLGIVALFAAQAMGIPVGFGDYASIALFATLASIGAASVPSAGLFLAASVLSVFKGPDGAPAISEAQTLLIVAFIFPFDRLLDMMRTLTNVTGDSAVAVAVAKWQGELDEETYREVARI